jgi:predicted RNase H-like HicB family nuclease
MSDTTITALRITDFGDEPYTLREPIPVEIEWTGDDYVAGFVEGGVYASGDTAEEAVENLTSSLLDAFDVLSARRDKLGIGLQKEFRVLSHYIIPHG